ncbi:MAG: hypothetical protein IJP13_08495 [Lachnospiraceae bacterium]|nr:hypothetical protein [Lachnospiraceae bacterium]
MDVVVIAKINGKEVLWEQVPPEQRKIIATTLNNRAIESAGYVRKGEIQRE